MANDFAKAIVKDLEDEGLVKKVNDTTMTDIDETGVSVELESLDNVLNVYRNGDLILELDYDDEDFNITLIKTLGANLNF